jgi:hypothetical protein
LGVLQVGTEKEKEKQELKKDRSTGKVHRWLEKKIIKTQGRDQSLPVEKISTGKRSSAAGPKQHRWALFECGAGERGNSKNL